MHNFIERIAPIVFALALANCGGNAPSTDAGDPQSDAMSTGALSLTVSNAQYATSIGGIAPSAGNRFLIVGFSLQNESVTTPVGGDPLFFTVELANHLVVNITGASARVPMACRADVSAAAGGTLNCAVAFELSPSDQPQTLGYDDHLGHTASAAIPTPAMPVSPIVGTWTGTATSGPVPVQSTFVFNADGTAILSLDAPSSCTGGIAYDGILWSATDEVITLSGMPSCSGSFVCSGSAIGCTSIGHAPMGDCTYSLSSDDDTLMLSCSGSRGTYTRM